MKTLLFQPPNVFWLGALLLLTGFTAGAAEKELRLADLQGTWQLVYQESGGKKLPDEKDAEMFHGKMVFKDNEVRYTAELPGFDFKFTCLLHADRQPTGIDLKVMQTPDGKGTGQTMLGICRRDDEILKICYNPAKRPAEFVAGEGSENVLIVVKKAAVK